MITVNFISYQQCIDLSSLKPHRQPVLGLHQQRPRVQCKRFVVRRNGHPEVQHQLQQRHLHLGLGKSHSHAHPRTLPERKVNHLAATRSLLLGTEPLRTELLRLRIVLGVHVDGQHGDEYRRSGLDPRAHELAVDFALQAVVFGAQFGHRSKRRVDPEALLKRPVQVVDLLHHVVGEGVVVGLHGSLDLFVELLLDAGVGGKLGIN